MSNKDRSYLHDNGLYFTRTNHNDTYDYINPEQFDLKGRAVFVTGASKGCGREIAISFARAGASFIAVAARSSLSDVEAEIIANAKAAKRPLPRVLCLTLDVTDEHAVQKAAQQIKQAFSRLDIIINNAGYLSNFIRIADSSIADWWKTMEVNIKGSYLVTRALIPLMIESSHGLKTIVNVSSRGAHLVTPGASSYQMSKLALIRFSEFINVEYAKHGFISFSIHPGGVLTELAKAMPEALHAVLVDTPQLAADTQVWLTAERREWLRGRYISCTWDMQELLELRKNIEDDDLLKVRMDVGKL